MNRLVNDRLLTAMYPTGFRTNIDGYLEAFKSFDKSDINYSNTVSLDIDALITSFAFDNITDDSTHTKYACINYRDTNMNDGIYIDYPAIRFNNESVEIMNAAVAYDKIEFRSAGYPGNGSKYIDIHRDNDNLYMCIGSVNYQLNPNGSSGTSTTNQIALSDNNTFTGNNTFSGDLTTFTSNVQLFKLSIKPSTKQLINALGPNTNPEAFEISYQQSSSHAAVSLMTLTNQTVQMNHGLVVVGGTFIEGEAGLYFLTPDEMYRGSTSNFAYIHRKSDGHLYAHYNQTDVKLTETNKTITHKTDPITNPVLGCFCETTGEIYSGYTAIGQTDCICRVRPVSALTKNIVGIITENDTFATHGDCLVRIAPGQKVELGDILVPTVNGARKATNEEMIFMMSHAIPRTKVVSVKTGIANMVATMLM
jgi:hypothetical protein